LVLFVKLPAIFFCGVTFFRLRQRDLLEFLNFVGLEETTTNPVLLPIPLLGTLQDPPLPLLFFFPA